MQRRLTGGGRHQRRQTTGIGSGPGRGRRNHERAGAALRTAAPPPPPPPPPGTRKHGGALLTNNARRRAPGGRSPVDQDELVSARTVRRAADGRGTGRARAAAVSGRGGSAAGAPPAAALARHLAPLSDWRGALSAIPCLSRGSAGLGPEAGRCGLPGTSCRRRYSAPTSRR